METDGQHNTRNESSGWPGALLQISYFTSNLQYTIFYNIILGLGKETNNQNWFPATQLFCVTSEKEVLGKSCKINPTPHGSFRERHPTACGLIGPTMTTTLYKIKDDCVGLICPTCNTNRSIQRLGGKVAALCMPIWSPYKRNLEDLKKVPNSWGCQDSGTYFRSSKFHF